MKKLLLVLSVFVLSTTSLFAVSNNRTFAGVTLGSDYEKACNHIEKITIDSNKSSGTNQRFYREFSEIRKVKDCFIEGRFIKISSDASGKYVDTIMISYRMFGLKEYPGNGGLATMYVNTKDAIVDTMKLVNLPLVGEAYNGINHTSKVQLTISGGYFMFTDLRPLSNALEGMNNLGK